MKLVIRTGIVCAALLGPAVTFAQQQSNAPLTRAQVREDLQRVEQAGYNPAAGEDPQYPSDIQAAESRSGQTTGIGGATPGTTQSGNQAMPMPTEKPARPTAQWPQPLGGN